jgi:hypothetical protein
MNTKTKTAILTAAALLMTAGTSMAAPRHDHRHGNGVNPYERAAIAQARAKVATVRARAWRDGRVTMFERFQIKNAERQLAMTIARARRT